MLQELISRWVGSTTGNQWIMLIDAVVMCDEPAVAQELATAVGCPLPHSGTTTDIGSNQIKLLSKLLVYGLIIIVLFCVRLFTHSLCAPIMGTP